MQCSFLDQTSTTAIRADSNRDVFYFVKDYFYKILVILISWRAKEKKRGIAYARRAARDRHQYSRVVSETR